jgi:DNA-binding CsgD family transcriptional regulator/tetratricopeptide (TPR) repeat protein
LPDRAPSTLTVLAGDAACSEMLVPPPLPPALSVASTHGFVGRADAMDALTTAWNNVQRGAGCIVLVAGEAGAGKTRLASEFARQAHGDGAAVLYGACDVDLALPFQPWVHALEQLVLALPRTSLDGEFGRAIAPLAPLAPRLEKLLTRSRPSPADPETERYRVLAGFVAALEESASRWPTLVVLDDVHWAGAQTLALLRHFARSGLPSGLMVIATYRDVGDEVTESLADCLADLRRVGGVERLRLAGLDLAAVERYVADAVGHHLDDDLLRMADGLAERCDGNAFYLGELWRHLVAVGAVVRTDERWSVHLTEAVADVPEGVREVVSARLGRLTPVARRVIDLAAVAGQRVELQVLARAADLGTDEIDAALNELAGCGLLVAAEGTPLAARFEHALARAAVEAAIAPLARARLHLAVAEALELVREADRRPVLAELARHFASAAALGPVDKALYYGRRAAAQASRAAAYDEAISHLRTLLDIVTSPPDRAEVLVELAGVQLRRGQYRAGRDACAEAFTLASEAGAAETAARAAVGFESGIHIPGLPGDAAIDVLRTAMALMGDGPSPMRPRLRASLGRALAFAGRSSEGVATAELAVYEARAAGEDETLAVALQALLVSVDEPHRQLAISTELGELAERLGDPWSALYASASEVRSLVAFGRLDEALRALARHEATSSTGRFAMFLFMTHAYRTVLALAAGDFAAAEAAAERAQAIGAADESPYDAGVYGLQMFAIRRTQGRLAEVAPVLRAVASMPDAPVLWRPGVAALYAATGMLDEAKTVFDALAPDRFAAVARDSVWPACITFLAETCLALGDVSQAQVLYDELVRFGNLNLMAGMTVCFGPADRLLGGLAELLGRPDVADEHFAIALALAERSDSPVWTAEVQHDWAGALARRGQHERATILARQAAETAERLDMCGRWGASDRAARPNRKPQAVLPDGLSDREVAVLRLVAAGLSNRSIGQKLFISQNTVANHVRAILRKTGCANRTDATAYAARNALLEPSD